ncbi:cyclic GMP-AMP synthase-like isoform X2 [Carettochelys insculpta]|uniref:cyclic GMP-AMP synthase-like isoform X2 n=1 Tax=Carettochelys insculpta TaxID=44489 RepID=UPI003EC0CA76
MSKPPPGARTKKGRAPHGRAGDSKVRNSKANEEREKAGVMVPCSLSQAEEFAVTVCGRQLRAPEAPNIQDSECSQQPSKICLNLVKVDSAKRRDESAGVTSELPETMPVKSRKKPSNQTPEYEGEGKVSQKTARGRRGKEAQDEKRTEGSETEVSLSSLAPKELSPHCPYPKEAEAVQRRRGPAGATSELPETMPVKSRKKPSNQTPEYEEEGKVPQKTARGGRGKGAQDEKRTEGSETEASLSSLALKELSPHCPYPKEAEAVQRRRGPAGHLGQPYSRSTSADLCESSEMAAAGLSMLNQDVAARIKEKVKALPLKHKERTKAAGIINGFIDPFITYLKEFPERPYFKEVTKLTTGSYYELVKIDHPDEFDLMLALPVPRYVECVEVDGCNGLYYKVTLPRKPRSFPTPFLLEDESTVSPVRVLEEFRKHVSQFITSSYKVPSPGWSMKLSRKKQNSPAVTVVLLDDKGGKFMSVDLVPALEISKPWPDSCGLGKDVEKWLGKKAKPRNKSFYLVAKQPHGQDDKEVWRISFSHIEKEILINHGNTKTCCESSSTKCCRKTCIRLLKSLIQDLKKDYPRQLSHLCSYYAKTSFLHTLTQWKEDSNWKFSDVACCFLRVMHDFIQHVEEASLAHFFIPNCNLFSSVPRRELKFLLECLREQKENGLPAFAAHKK